MKYYKIEIEHTNKKDNILIGCANGEYIPNANHYFYEMREGKILLDAPVFDYFFLKSFEEKKYWEKYLMDVHDFTGEGSQIGGWFVSEDLKLLLENFNLTQPHHFYPSKLLYKGNKLDYFIFQFAGDSMVDAMTTSCIIDWSSSIFSNLIDESNSSINSSTEFIDESNRVWELAKQNNLSYSSPQRQLKTKKIVLLKSLDFFPMSRFRNDDLVSERLKQAIEDMGITGFEFSELDYEVVVKK
jgi:hypothetical protein